MQRPTGKSRHRVLDRVHDAVSGLRNVTRRPVADDDRPRALAVSCRHSEQEALQEAFRAAGWELAIADSVTAALARQKKFPVPIILCGRDFPESDWQKTVLMFTGLQERPWVILLSSRCDQNLWEELTAIGGSDILRTPLNAGAVTRSVKSGWQLWRHLRHIHDVTKSEL